MGNAGKVGRRHPVAPMEPGNVLRYSSKLSHGTLTIHTQQRKPSR